MTGAVLDALESPRVQEALRDGGHGPGRAAPRGTAGRNQARRRTCAPMRAATLAGGVIDRVDWLDIRQRTEDAISKARREYDRLSGSATVMSDIPPSERVRDAWESWSMDRKRAAIKAVLHRVVINPFPPGRRPALAGNSRTLPSAANAKWRSCGSASNSTGACSNHAAHTSGGDEPGDRLRRFVLMPLVCSCGVFFRCAAAGGHHARARRAPRPLPGPQCAPGNHARPGSAAHGPRRPAGSRRAPGRSWAAGRCHGACSSRPSVPPSVYARYGQTRARGPGRDRPSGRSLTGTAPRACARASVPR